MAPAVILLSALAIVSIPTVQARVRAQSREIDEQCGVYGWEVPPPPTGLQLVQVNAIIRHGDRTAWTGAPCWPNDSATWDCDLTASSVPALQPPPYGKVTPRLYQKIYLHGKEPLQGNCSVGQLTSIGYSQHVKNGKSLYNAYVRSGFLPQSLRSEDVYVRSDDEPRTIQSAESLLLGLFPPEDSSSTQFVPLYTRDTDFDYIAPNSNLCPVVGYYQQEFKKSKAWMQHKNFTNALIANISSATGLDVNGSENLSHFVDCLTTHLCHSFSWPAGVTHELYQATWNEAAWEQYNMYKYPSVQTGARAGIGFLLKEIWGNMNNSLADPNSAYKFLLYSGHDTTLMPTLVAFQVDNGVWTPYASMILVELYKNSTSGTASVRIIYNGEVLQLPFCGGVQLCDYNTFTNYMTSVTPPEDYLDFCSSPGYYQHRVTYSSTLRNGL